MVSNITNYIHSLNFKYRSNLMSDDVEVGLASFLHRSYINGKGSFVDAHTVHIEGKQDITANHIVIATGGRPVIP